MKWYRKAAEQGNVGGQYHMGLMYSLGKGVSEDYREAAKWFRKAADEGHVWAQVRLGLIYQEGQGVSQDYGEAMKWYRLAAELGHAGAQARLGVMYVRTSRLTIVCNYPVHGRSCRRDG